MSDYAGWLSGGATGPEALGKLWGKNFNAGVATATNPTAYQVTQRGAGANMSVDIAPGSALLNLTDYGVPVWSSSIINVAVTAADPTNPRISIVVVYIDLTAYGANNNQGATKFKIVDGVPAGTPSDPSDSTIQTAVGLGNPWMKFARVTLPATAASVINTYITDLRLPVGFSGTFSVGPNTFFWNGWQAASGNFTYASNNGNKEFLLTTSNDLRSVIQVGDKLSVARGTTPPTQCMSFAAASSQYASNSSPAGMTDTGTFTTEAWVYLNSYSGSDMGIISRDTGGTSGGFGMLATATNGRLSVYYRNASGTSQIITYQSLPLKRWTHVACVVTSIGTPAATTYINGISVPNAATNTAATTRIQAGSLQVGGINSINYFDGYISEARYWSTNQSQANIQANMAINIAAQANLAVLIPGGGTFNDISGNSNNLTASGGATATQAANPFNATEFGFVTAITSSQITVFCGTDCSIPNQTLGAVTYSHDRSPYGFPSARTKWIVETIMGARLTNSGGTVGTWFNLGWQLSIPSGEWDAGYDAYCIATTASGTAFLSPAATLSTSNNGATDPRFSMNAGVVSVATTDTEGILSKIRPLSLPAQTIYYLNISSLGGTTNALYMGNNTNLSAVYKIQAVCAYA